MNKRLILLSSSLLVLLYASLILAFNVIFPKHEEANIFKTHYNNRVTVFTEENKYYSDKKVDVVFLGDSLTEGYNTNYYYSEFVTLNRGISGDTTFGLEKRLDVSAYQVKPKVVVMLIGANNFKTMLQNYEDIIRQLKINLPDSEIVCLSLTAMGGEHWGRNNDIAKENNKEIKKIAEAYNCHFIDLFTPLFDKTTNEVYEGYTVDGGHFTRLGYDIITSLIKPKIRLLLG